MLAFNVIQEKSLCYWFDKRSHFKSWRFVRTNLADSQQVFEWALYVTRVLLDLHPSTFHNCTLDRVGLAERETLCPVLNVHQSRHRMHAWDTYEWFEFTIFRGTNDKKIKVMKRSSGHARTEIRRRYAIAWVEYIDLSRSRPPRSHRHRRCYRRLTSLWISPRFEPRIQLCLRLWKTLVSRPHKLYFNFDSPLSASRSCDIRAKHYCPWYWRCRPCYARTSRIDPRRISTFVTCRWYYAAWRTFVPEFFLLVVERYRKMLCSRITSTMM